MPQTPPEGSLYRFQIAEQDGLHCGILYWDNEFVTTTQFYDDPAHATTRASSLLSSYNAFYRRTGVRHELDSAVSHKKHRHDACGLIPLLTKALSALGSTYPDETRSAISEHLRAAIDLAGRGCSRC